MSQCVYVGRYKPEAYASVESTYPDSVQCKSTPPYEFECAPLKRLTSITDSTREITQIYTKLGLEQGADPVRFSRRDAHLIRARVIVPTYVILFTHTTADKKHAPARLRPSLLDYARTHTIINKITNCTKYHHRNLRKPRRAGEKSPYQNATPHRDYQGPDVAVGRIPRK